MYRQVETAKIGALRELSCRVRIAGSAMLNKLLYDALEKLFGAVSVVNDGVEATVSPYSDGSGDWSIPQGAERGEQYVVNCPFCGDRKRHLYISYLSYARPAVNGIAKRTAWQVPLQRKLH